MDAIHKFLLEAKKQKAKVQVCYMGGEAPGSERFLYIKSTSLKNQDFIATEDVRDGKEKTFSYRKLYWAKYPEASARVENPDALKYLESHLSREGRKRDLERAVEIDRLGCTDTLTNGATQIGERTYRIHINSLDIYVQAPSRWAINFFVNQFQRTIESYVGGIWQLIDVIIECEIDWPAWQAYLLHVNRIGAKARGSRPTLRQVNEGKKKIPVQKYWEQSAIYQSLNTYRPEDVSDAEFFEFEPVPFASMYKSLRGLPVVTRIAYIKNAWDSLQKFSFKDCPFLEQDKNILEGCGLLVTPSSSAAKIRGEIFPPSGFSWHQFQAFRQQLKWMANAMVDLHCGAVRDPIAQHILAKQ